MKYRATYLATMGGGGKKRLDRELYGFEARDDSEARYLAEGRLSEIRKMDPVVDCRLLVIYNMDLLDLDSEK